MNIAIIGTGYVGLTSGACLAASGHTVVCVDNNSEKVASLRQGISPIFEPGLEEIIKAEIASGRLKFDEAIVPAVKNSEVIFICVNTPPKADGQADLKYVEMVARDIAGALDDSYKVIVDKSTVPVKTAEKVRETILRYCAPEAKFDVVSNPEFLREGSAVDDTLHPDRIVIGVDSEAAEKVMRALYEPIIKATNAPVKIVSVKSAELIKHGANTFLAAKISFANLIAETCDAVGANAQEVLDAIGLDERIGRQFLYPGIGFGGSCFPKDIAAYRKTLEILGIDYAFVDAIEAINRHATDRFLKKIEKELWVLDGKQIGILGLAFKPNTDDMRNAPALAVIAKLKADGARIKAYDPQAMENAKKTEPNIEYVNSAIEVAQGSDALIICTEWPEFKALDLATLKGALRTPILFDGRNVFDPAEAKKVGFKYFGVGRS